MTVEIDKLEGLVHLAKETSDEGRRKLLRQVTDLFMDNHDSISSVENDYFGDIMNVVSSELEIEVRKQLSEELANVATAPKEFIKKLANDEITVARPILMQSTVLDDSDLVDVIKNQGQGHMMAISVRPTLSETVTDNLVEHGNDEVLASVISNEGADISSNTMITVVDRVKQNEVLHEPLITHRDLAPDQVVAIIAHVSDNLRAQLLKANPDINPAHLTQIINDNTKKFTEDAKQTEDASVRLIDRKEKLNKLDSGYLIKLLREQKIPDFISGFSRIAKIDMRTARHTVFDQEGQRLAILCKAIDFSREDFAEIIQLTDFKKTRSPEDIETLVGVYGRFTVEAAQRALRFYRTRSNYNKSLPKKGA